MSTNATEEVKPTAAQEATAAETTVVEEHAEKKAASEDYEEAITFYKGIDEFYPKDHIEKPLEDSKISRRNISFYGVMGQHSYKRYNVNFLEDDIIIFITGNKYQIFNLSSKSL